MTGETTTIEIPKHLAHIRRAALPWVNADDEMTECGRISGEMTSVISHR